MDRSCEIRGAGVLRAVDTRRRRSPRRACSRTCERVVVKHSVGLASIELTACGFCVQGTSRGCLAATTASRASPRISNRTRRALTPTSGRWKSAKPSEAPSSTPRPACALH
jgi:hypothetical protein